MLDEEDTERLPERAPVSGVVVTGGTVALMPVLDADFLVYAGMRGTSP